jgi:uncharacterized protein YlzI (FlbEa/FlbD family)
MEIDRIFSADQIEVHPDLALILKEYTKAVLKENPEDVVAFSTKYFQNKVGASDAPKEEE